MHKLKNPIFTLLFASVFFTSCSGQTKSTQINNTVAGQLSFTGKKAKLTKTQGTNEYQNIHCSLQDKVGNLWFGTTGEGVYLYDGKLFTQFTIQNGLSNNTVWSILEDKKGNIWFGTNKGLCCYDGKTIKQISMSLNAAYLPNYAANVNPSLINEVFSIMQDKKGVIWFGTADGIVCYDGNNFTRFLDNHTIVNDSSLTLKSVQCMFEDKKGNIWFGSGPMAFEGIGLYNGKSLTKFRPQKEGWIRNITDDENGNILFATRHIGVITFDGKNFNDFSEPENLRKDLINTILLDRKGNIWYASDYTNDSDASAGGCWKFDGKSFIEFTKKDGLSNTSIYSLSEDKAGNIWIGTRNCGLYRYNGQTFETFSE